MMLLRKEDRKKLMAAERDNPNNKPLVKFFVPWGAGTWLFSELDADGDTLFGLCDLGMNSPELGYASLEEITAVNGPLGLKIERDRYFRAEKTLSEYADEAREKGRIVA
jgi:hypothetical protein